MGHKSVSLVVNGVPHDLVVSPGETLLTSLRERLGLTGAKQVCNRGECGACSVLVNGEPTCSCIQLTVLVRGEVTTVEGIPDEMIDLAESLAEEGGLQCGYCTPGQMISGTSLVRSGVTDEQEIRRGMAGNICRCTGYSGIVRAISRASARRQAARLDQ